MVIYLTRNHANHKWYIGKDSKNDPHYYGSGVLLNKAIAKYGKSNFSKEILAEADTLDMLDNLERYYIAEYNAVSDPMSYNIAEGGNGGNTLAGMSESQKNDFKQKLKNRWQNYTEDERKTVSINISNSLTGKTKSPSHCEKIRQHKIDTAKEYGPKVSESLKAFWASDKGADQKRVLALKCRKVGDQNGMYGKHHTDETKRKISESKTGAVLPKKCSSSDIALIKELYQSGKTVRELSEKFAVSGNTIRRYLSSNK